MRVAGALCFIFFASVGCKRDLGDSGENKEFSPEVLTSEASPLEDHVEDVEDLRGWPEIVEASEPSVISLEVESDEGRGTGTGFVVSPDGVVVTNLHVVKGAITITGKNHQGFSLHCQGLITVDEERDLALLKFAAKKLPVLELSERALSKGEEIMAIGNPKGYDSSVTTGIVSAFRDDDSTETIQFDAAVSPGSSGSPLFDRTGKVAGVVTSGDASRQGINFAVASSHVVPLLEAAEQLEPVSLAEAFSQPLPESAAEMDEEEIELPLEQEGQDINVASIEAEQDKRLRMLNVFWRSYWDSFDEPTGSSWAIHFVENCDYQYKESGLADRAFIAKEAFSLKQKYPQRRYSLLREPEIVKLSEDKISFDFDYEYFYQSGNTLRAGVSKTDLALVWTDEEWLVYKFREAVEPYKKDRVPTSLPERQRQGLENPIGDVDSLKVGAAGYMLTRDGVFKIWNNSFQKGDGAEWDGKSNANGFADGRGTLSWFKGGVFQYCYTGLMVQGRFDGEVRTADKRGNVGYGRYDGGKKSGTWGYSNKSGTKTWTKRY